MTKPKTPSISVDVIIRLRNQDPELVILIERKNPPHGWALPGGFVDIGETLEQAAIRETKEETNLEVQLRCLLGCYSNPQRDSRGHTISAVFIGEAEGVPEAADDALRAKTADAADQSIQLAFDHRLILDDYLNYLRNGKLTPLR